MQNAVLWPLHKIRSNAYIHFNYVDIMPICPATDYAALNDSAKDLMLLLCERINNRFQILSMYQLAEPSTLLPVQDIAWQCPVRIDGINIAVRSTHQSFML